MEFKLPQQIKLSHQQMNTLSTTFARARQEKIFRYPWDGLEQHLKSTHRSGLPFVGYGSLLNKESAALTLSRQTLEARQPVVAFGALRVFNYVMPPSVKRYGEVSLGLNRAALNVRLTARPEHALNAVRIDIPFDGIGALRDRENGYDLAPLACIPWEMPDQPPFIAYILSCPEESDVAISKTDNSLLPHKRYYEVCRDGASEFGESFLKFFLSTTFLADGVTPMSEWEGKNAG